MNVSNWQRRFFGEEGPDNLGINPEAVEVYNTWRTENGLEPVDPNTARVTFAGLALGFRVLTNYTSGADHRQVFDGIGRGEFEGYGFLVFDTAISAFIGANITGKASQVGVHLMNAVRHITSID